MSTVTIEKVSFFRNYSLLRYITSWDDEFSKNYGKGIRFYSGEPKYLVLVSIYADKDKLRPEDITISIGTMHNPLDSMPDLEARIKEKSDEILEICKSCYQMEFILNMKTMTILSINDFTDKLPHKGLNTFFMFNPAKDANIRCVINTNSSIFKTDELYSWLIAYAVSCNVSLQPVNKVEIFAKQFFQVIGCMMLGKEIIVSNDRSILNCVLSDTSELLMESPGNTTRVSRLYIDAVQEKVKLMEKQAKKKKYEMERKHAN